MLTMPHNIVYSEDALAKSSAGIETPNQGAKALLSGAFFMSVVYGRLCGGSILERRTLVGSFNSAQSATLLIETNGGSSLNKPEDTTMSNDPACIEKAVRLFAQLPYSKQYICLTILKNPELLKILANLPGDHMAVICEHMKALLFREVY